MQVDYLPAEPPGKPKVSLPLLQQIFPNQETNWGLVHCRWILYQLSYQGIPTGLVQTCWADSNSSDNFYISTRTFLMEKLPFTISLSIDATKRISRHTNQRTCNPSVFSSLSRNTHPLPLLSLIPIALCLDDLASLVSFNLNKSLLNEHYESNMVVTEIIILKR